MITNKNLRRYEVSLWTLQDGFITVLKEFNSSVKGTIEEPEMELSDDSEDTFSFSLPMYIRENGQFKENPIWYNVTNGNLIANLRKVKVIFYKGTEDQRIFEFVITKVTETHEGFEKKCEVECEGLAFNELGKVGYNIELSQDLYEMECEDGIEYTETCTVKNKEVDGETIYYINPSQRTELLTDLVVKNNDKDIGFQSIEVDNHTYVNTVILDKQYDNVTITYKYTPLNNINYWLDKVFQKQFNWTYRINMDWSDYPEDERDSDKIYEDAYIENWELNDDGVLIATSIIDSQEKFRIVDESESNRYNLTQTIAETFGVFCRYIYEYDDNYYITNRIVEFYNSAIKSNEEHLDFTYYYDTEDLSREMDSADQISKMFVLSGSGDDLLNSSITEVDANKSLENYLLNFDYLYQINGVDQDQYDYVSTYETKMREFNKQLQELQQQRTIYENALTEFLSKRDNADIAAAQAAEAMEDERSHIRHLLDSDKVDYDKDPETLSCTGLNPQCAIIVTEGEETNKTKSCEINQEGVLPNSIIVFTSMNGAEKYHKKRYGADETSINLSIQQVTVDDEVKYVGTINNNGTTITLKDTQNSPYFPSEQAVAAAANTWVLNESGALLADDYLSSENYQIVIDQGTGFAIGLKNINCPDRYKALFLVYNYNLELYHKILAEQWATVANENKEAYKEYAKIVDKIDGPRDENGEWISDDHGLLQKCIDEINRISELKQLEIIDFENYMGPALREGTWQPDDDYAKYGDKRQALLSLGGSTAFAAEDVSIGWDKNLFDGEDSNYEEYGINKEKVYYPCIRLTEELIQAINNYLSEDEEENRLLDIGYLWDDTVVPGMNPLITSRGNDPIPVDFPQIFRIGSEAKIAFIKSKDDPDEPVIPVLMLTNAEAYCSTFDIVNETGASQTDILKSLNGCIGILSTEEIQLEEGLEGDIEIRYVSKALTSAPLVWIDDALLEKYDRVYPRIRIPYLNFINNLDDCRLYLGENQLNAYADYNVMSRYDLNSEESYTDLSFWQQDEQDLSAVQYAYYITINPETIIKNAVSYGDYKLCYKLSNTGLAIYLDALQVLKENAFPKVTYDISPIVFNTTIMEKLYDQIHRVIHINDAELKFKNVTGYISGLTLNLDNPSEDTIEVKNYTTKFEDLFSSIVASTASIKKNATSISVMSQAFISTGEISEKTLQSSLELADLTLRFNNDKFIINDNGIKAYSDDGIVHYSSQGIFTATTKDSDGNWEWNTSILPSGISANSITTGQLNTNLIRIYSGNDLRFQMNGDGLFAYKSWFTENLDVITDEDEREEIEEEISARDGLDPAQYVVMNSDGLFLTAKEGAYIFDKNTNTYTTLAQDVDRVEISWEGLILRNNDNERTFYADPDTGNLNILGNITVEGDNITAELNSDGLRFGNYRLVRTLVNNSECLSFVYEEGE